MKNTEIEYENLRKLNASFEEDFKAEFQSFLESGWYILGAKVKAFEEEFGSYLGSSYNIGVANGMDAITIALKALQIEKGSEVLVASNTYIATILPIFQCGLKPILVEPKLDTYNIDEDLIEEHIGTNTKAIIITHLYGRPCNMDKIVAIAEKYDLALIEDCAQAHGAMFKNQKVGTFGIGAFSFYPTKNLGALGDGGLISCSTKEIENKCRTIRNYGFSTKKYYSDEIGLNSRLDEVQAVFLSIKLKKLEQITEHKRKLARLYLDNIKSDFILPVEHDNYKNVYHIFPIRHEKRDQLRAFLLKNNIKTEIHYPIPPHKQKSLQDQLSQKYPLAEVIHDTILSLPISFYHNENDIFKVIDTINKF